jgi:pantoate--beta-alanine ligase
MQIVHSIAELRKTVKKWKSEGQSIGLVPTMGFLHEGHESLILKAVSQNDRVIVSDFVNPTQFAPNEDFESYPRDINKDAALCERAGADIIFNPSPEEMYHDPKVHMVADELSEKLCGKTRPIHFGGVCTVVSKLFNIAQPDRAYFGQKDAQQLIIIRKMVLDMNFDIEIVGCPIIREADGLAKSSRNTYLSAEEREQALCLSKAIEIAKSMIAEGERRAAEVISVMARIVVSNPLARIDYISAVDPADLEDTETLTDGTLVAMAVYIGKTRLIDNFIVGE